MLSALEQAGVLHALQVLTENAIGKAKVWIKQRQLPVPVSAYDSFAQLHREKIIDDEALRNWTLSERGHVDHRKLGQRAQIPTASSVPVVPNNPVGRRL
jgi:uncharacterized protein YutE (UPF0331/DUF86 family)